MALEDFAMMRAVHGSTVLYPCDANQTARLVGLMVEREGISYIRTTREKTPILYTDRLEEFRVGGSRIVRGGQPGDAVAVIAAGITVHEAVKAADQLKATIRVRVIDAYSVKPIDAVALVDAVRATGGRLASWTTGPRVGSATRCWPRSRRPVSRVRSWASGISRCGSCRRRVSPPSCSRRRGFRRSTSPTP